MKASILLGVSGFALASLPAQAQTVEPAAPPAPVAVAAAEAAPSDEYILVTGSRILRPNLESAVPITTLSVQELTQTGEVSIGDRLSLLPQFRTTRSTQNSGRFIGTAGLNILDLRGLGTARTLVLQNGRRHVTAEPGSSTVDTNTIPVDLIERVDVVTGGNSAVYGSDAVAGVVNFVLKQDFEGFRVRGQAGISSRGDRPTYLGSITAGKNFNDGRGNIAVSLEYTDQDALYFTERDGLTGAFSGRRQFNATENVLTPPEPSTGNGIPDTTFLTGIRNIGISEGSAYTSACPADTPANAARRAVNCTGLKNNSGVDLGRVFLFNNDGTLTANGGTDMRPFGSANTVGPGGRGSTLRLTGQLQPSVKRYSANLLTKYEFTEAAEVFLEGKFVRTESVQEGQPTFISGTLNTSFRLENPYLSTQARNLLVSSLAPGATTFTINRFNTDIAGRGEDHERETYRFVGGLRGTFNDDWRYEVALNYGHLKTYYETAGNVNVAKFNASADAVRNAAGQIVCRINTDASTTNDDPNCRPQNLFGVGNISQEAKDYYLVTSTRDEWAEQINAVAFMSGDSSDWFEMPGGPIAFSIGAEWRKEKSYAAYDEVTRGGSTFLNALGVFEPPALEVKEAFGEIRIPIVADRPFFHELTLEGAARVSDYNLGSTGSVWAYNIGLIWAPVEDVRFRGGYAQSVRAPTTTNLYGALNQTFLNGLVDPCSQNNIRDNPNRVANCAAAGVPTTQTFNGTTEPFTNIPTSGISGFNGSNPDLFEETGTSWTLGAVVQPRFVPGLTVTIDYYNIEVTNAIFTLGAQTIINQCYNDAGGIDNPFCNAITRNPNGTFAGQSNVTHGGVAVSFPTTGSSFTQGPFNFAKQKSSGIDFDIAYQLPSSGDFRFSARSIISYLINRDNYTDINRPDFINQQKLELGDPEWAANLNLTFGFKEFEFAYNMRYIGGMTTSLEYETMNSVQGRPPENPDQRPFTFYPDYVYHDIRMQIDVGGPKVYFGIDNLLDTQPPYDLLGTEAGAGVYVNTGRYFYIGVDAKF